LNYTRPISKSFLNRILFLFHFLSRGLALAVENFKNFPARPHLYGRLLLLPS